jgi:ribonuclease HI
MSKAIMAFTDGAAKGNPGPGGWGAIIVTAGRVRELGGGVRHTTNNRMELTGPIAVLTSLMDTPGEVAIYTDSSYVIRGIRDWIWNWQRSGWKTREGKDVLNRELWEQLSRLVQTRKGSVDWRYVPGHSGIPGNERVDEIATMYALGEEPGLYDGPLADYPVKVFDIPEDTRVPESSSPRSGGGKNAKAYSYLSVVDGIAIRHATWAECEQRVKGRPARHKKAMSAEHEAEILKEWGVRLGGE